MTKIVLNRCYGGFHLSGKALNWLRDRGIRSEEVLLDWELGLIARHNPLLVELVEELGIDQQLFKLKEENSSLSELLEERTKKIKELDEQIQYLKIRLKLLEDNF